MSGVKHDDGKAPLDLLPWRALAEVAHVLGHGARKYGRDNWRGLRDERRVIAAALRHAAAHLEGEDIDEESGRAHLAHLVCEGLFALTFTLERLDERAPEPVEVPESEPIVCHETILGDTPIELHVHGAHVEVALHGASTGLTWSSGRGFHDSIHALATREVESKCARAWERAQIARAGATEI